MNKKQLAKFKSVVTRAVKKNLKGGGKLIDGEFIIDGEESLPHETFMCPIEVVATGIKIKGKTNPSYEDRLSQVLGFAIKSVDMWSFILGYDNVPQRNAKRRLAVLADVNSLNNDLFLFGKSFRKLYKPMTAKEKAKIE